ncbi:MAG: DNA topoisomerase VI subunit B [Phycisphaeraceae bacterium]|nr:DNA topoisomerase VI subunit B [Phycisphaeraceae bacterium]
MEAKPRAKSARKVDAESMAKNQREISVSEFFAKNRHLLGFDNPRKALLTTVKEAVDNALDACEEAGILPDITVRLEELVAPPSPSKSGRYRITITDNGPGIVRKQVEHIFGRLLYGSKFHRLKMSRGQQGIGISAAGMYGLMTTGKPMVILTRPSKRKPAHHIELAMDTTRNRPEVTIDRETDEFPETSTGTGTSVTIELEARYTRGKTSIDAYLEQTGIANPHAHIVFYPPKSKASDADPTALSGKSENASPLERAAKSDDDESSHHPTTQVMDDHIIYPRAVDELPPETSEIKPHPYGVELGTFLRLLKQTDEKQLAGFLKNEFCRVPPSVVKEVASQASTKKLSITGQTYISRIDHAAAELIYNALQNAKLRSPPTDCLAPIGVRTMLAGMLKGVRAEFYAASTRAPAVYRGMPFQIEVAIAYGGDLPGDEPSRVIRFANRVPLLYQQSACCSFKSVIEASWRNYGLTQPRGSVPVAPMVVMIHMASVWVPFTSESKEAIADYDDIRKEMKLALQECGRKLGTYMRKRQKMKREGQRRDVFERYIGEISKSCNALTGYDAKTLYDALLEQARQKTEIADAVLDEDGQIVRATKEEKVDDGVIIVGDDGTVRGLDEPKPARPLKKKKKKRAAVGSTQDASERVLKKKRKKISADSTRPDRPLKKKKKRSVTSRDDSSLFG